MIQQLPIDQLVVSPYQPRSEFDPEMLQELAASITANGLIQPVVVRPLNQGNYEIVAGERRWRAAQIAGLSAIECLVKAYSAEQAAAAAMIENIQRVDLNPIEEARGYQQLLSEFNYSHEEIAAIVGKSRTKITNLLRLLKLDNRVQALLIEGNLSEGHGKILAGLADHHQFPFANSCVTKQWSVRKAEVEGKKLQSPPKNLSSSGDTDLSALEQALSDHLGSRVSIDFNANERGTLKINFHNFEILEGIFQKLGFSSNFLG